MDLIYIVFIVFIYLVFIYPIISYFEIRNEWISMILDNAFKKGGIKEYNKYLSYETMLFKKFWVWNKDKLKKENR